MTSKLLMLKMKYLLTLCVAHQIVLNLEGITEKTNINAIVKRKPGKSFILKFDKQDNQMQSRI